MTIPEITRALRATYNVTQQDVVNIIGVAAQASKNKSALIKARYHMFAKALEGAYVTLGQNKKLMLNRNRSITIGDENWKVFECAICDDCGRVAVVYHSWFGFQFGKGRWDKEKCTLTGACGGKKRWLLFSMFFDDRIGFIKIIRV